MKKPNYIEIRLPGNKSAFSGARGKYLKRLEGKVLNVNFAKEKERKLFEYVVMSSYFCRVWDWESRKNKWPWAIKLELKVPKEDPDKVL